MHFKKLKVLENTLVRNKDSINVFKYMFLSLLRFKKKIQSFPKKSDAIYFEEN